MGRRWLSLKSNPDKIKLTPGLPHGMLQTTSTPLSDFSAQIAAGEDSTRQFKLDIRNPILVSYVAKGLLPYHGLGSGIRRAVSAWPEIDLVSDHDACLFTATVHRHPPVGETEKTSGKTSGKILAAIRENSSLTIPELAELAGITELSVARSLQKFQKLQKEGRLHRSGPVKGGHWEIIE
jgi:ATP-dependent DNA helicase RecG